MFLMTPKEVREFQEYSLKMDGMTIFYLEEPSEKLQLIAVRQNGLAIQFIKNPSDKVQKEAYRQNPDSLKYIQSPSKGLKRLIAFRSFVKTLFGI